MPIDPILKEQGQTLAKELGLKNISNLVRYLLRREIDKASERAEKSQQAPII